MVQYLSIIRKSDFIDLFKYGHLFIHHSLTFHGELSEHDNDTHLFDLLTAKMNLFEYSFEYLVLYFQTEKYMGSSFEVQMSEVQGIYAFNSEAKKEMSISFDPRIHIVVSPWAKWFDELQQKLFIQQSMRGVDNLWKVFNLNEAEKDTCKAIIPNDIIVEVFRQLFAYERPMGNQSLWTYLLRYERHSLYPRNMKGFFCDFIHVVCNWTKQKELPGEVAETTGSYQNLVGEQFEQLKKIVSESPLNGITSEATGCNFCIIAPLFLFLKSIFAEGVDLKINYNGSPVSNIVEYAKSFGVDFSLATYLLGITLGFDKTYDTYYEAIELPIFKKVVKVMEPSSVQVENTNNPSMDVGVSENLDAYKVNTLESQNKPSEMPDFVANIDHRPSDTLFPEVEQDSKKVLATFYTGKNFKNAINVVKVYTKEDLERYKNDNNYHKKNDKSSHKKK